MNGSLYRWDVSAPSTSFVSAEATRQRGLAGIFDGLRRSGVAIAAAVALAAAITAGALIFVSGHDSGSFQALAEVEKPVKPPAPAAARDARPPAATTVAATRGPRVGLDRAPAADVPVEVAADTGARLQAAGDMAASVQVRTGGGAGVDTAAPATTDPVRTASAVSAADAEPPVSAKPDANSGGVRVSEPAGTGAGTAIPEDAAPLPPAVKTASQSPSGLSAATTTTWVHLRAGPDNKARAIATVPANAPIMAPSSCKFWCMVEYRGQRGYIYKDFVRRSGSGTQHG